MLWLTHALIHLSIYLSIGVFVLVLIHSLTVPDSLLYKCHTGDSVSSSEPQTAVAFAAEGLCSFQVDRFLFVPEPPPPPPPPPPHCTFFPCLFPCFTKASPAKASTVMMQGNSSAPRGAEGLVISGPVCMLSEKGASSEGAAAQGSGLARYGSVTKQQQQQLFIPTNVTPDVERRLHVSPAK